MIGVLLGIMFIVCQQMLIIFAIFVERSQMAVDPASVSAQQAMAVFSFFIFITYASFGTLLAVFRGYIIKEDDLNYDEIEASKATEMTNEKNVDHEDTSI